jgi:signal transduction histidine kinase
MTAEVSTSSRLMRLVAGAAVVASQTELSSVLTTTVETAMDLTGARYGALGVLDDHGNHIEFIHRGMDAKTVARIGAFPEGRGVLGTITRTGTTVRTDSIAGHPDAVGFPAHHPPMESFLGVPVHLENEVFGNLYLAEKPGGFTIDDEELMEGLAVVAGAAVNTARLHGRLRRLAVVEDRERIARDLHDAIIQDLFATGLTLQAAAQKVVLPEGQKVIADTVYRLDEVISSLRRFIFDLRPPVWSERDLRAEMSQLIEHLARPYDVRTEMRFSGKFRKPSPDLVDDALQLLSEALSNALRHSESDVVRIDVGRERDELLIVVSDDGQGFDVTDPRAGMGIDNIRARAERAGGEATITSEIGVGTTVHIRLPM